MKMDEEEEDPRHRAFLFLGPDSESLGLLGMEPSSRHPLGSVAHWDDSSGARGCRRARLCRAASLRAPLQASCLAWQQGDVGCGKQDTGLGFALPPTSLGLASAVGSKNQTQCGVLGCPWSLGVHLGKQRLFRACLGQFAAWQSPGRSVLLLGGVELVPRFEVGISGSNWSCQPWWESLCGHPLLPQLCSLTSATHRFLSCWDQALPPCCSLRVLISAFAP